MSVSPDTSRNTSQQLKHALLALKEARARLEAANQTQREPIAIVGMACRFPGSANTLQAFWNMLRQGEDGIGEIPPDRWASDTYYDPDPAAPGKMYTRRGGFVAEATSFDAAFYGISPREARRMDPQQRLLLEVAWEALEQAGQDPNRLTDRNIGVFIGVSDNQYTQHQIRSEGDVCVDDPNFLLGSSCSAAAGRLSYLFDFRGPTLAVDTACSSSLVAVHLACQSLRTQECGLALVGGVHVISSPETFINYCKMGMLSADGYCKTFDAGADGFGVGEGCGVVVLKRWSDAVAAGDHVLALIRGSAINEDGRSNGLTAPNGLSQQAVIRQALENAGISPTQISYVEAHGSGTPLGDPIEIESIQAALCQSRPPERPLLVGTVKTNLGHLTTAAGMAGLIKTVLSLQHQAIPPHLHLRQPNPYITWNEHQFQVPTQLTPWKPINGRRLAGVSSFGWAGTNAHVVLEEAPTPQATPADPHSRTPFLLPLSARTETALAHATGNLATYLQTHPNAPLSDIAYTLQVGRAAFDFRRIVVCHSAQEAITGLENPTARNVLSSVVSSHSRPITFMFPGLGDQYINMAAGLYHNEPLFRQVIDHCCEVLQPYLGVDLRPLLFSQNGGGKETSVGQMDLDLRQMLGRANKKDVSGSLKQTSLAQPALFVLEYALAQLWMSWGIQPQAMIGYSLGEYVAACLAGVFSLEDALQLVARRAQMIDALPAGSMLAVALPEESIAPLLSEAVSLSGINGPTMGVVAGSPTAIADLEQTLIARGIACRPVSTTHAFHSRAMTPIMDELTQLVAQFERRPPQIPYISNVTGTWITDEQAVDPRYWATHMRQPVRFADGVRALWEKPGNILVEVGVGQMLGSMAMQHPARASANDPIVLSSLPSAHDATSDQAFMVRSLGQLWLSGCAIDWSGFHTQASRRRLPLPTYPFERQQYWTHHSPPTSPEPSLPPAPVETSMAKQEMDDWFHLPTWQRVPLLPPNNAPETQPQNWLLFADALGVGTALATQLRQRGDQVIVVTAGDAFQRLQQGFYTINPQLSQEYEDLLHHLSLLNLAPDHIVHLWNVWTKERVVVDEDSVTQAQELGFYSLLFLAQALGKQQTTTPIQLHVISNNMQDMSGGEATCPEKATMLGMIRVIPQEYPHIRCQSIDVALPAESRAIAMQLLPELSGDIAETVVAYRGRSRWVQSFVPAKLTHKQSGLDLLRQRGVYLITGGFGGIGFALARSLAKKFQARLILVGRSPLPPRTAWSSLLVDENAPVSTRNRIRQILALEESGAEVLAATADAADKAQMQQVIAEAHARFGHIHGVFHVAGVPGEGLIQAKAPDVAAQVLRPKVQGSVMLHNILRQTQQTLDFIVLYSSLGAVMGGLGEVDYCAANAFLGAFSHYLQSHHGINAVTIDWGLWQWDTWQSNMAADVPGVYEQIRQIRQTYGISFAEGEEALWRVLATPLPQVLVSPLDLQATMARQYSFTITDFLQDVSRTRQQTTHPRPNLRNPYVAPSNETERAIAAIWADVLAMDSVGIHDHFLELGGNSLLGMMIIARLKQAFGIALSAASLYEGPTVSELYKLISPNEETDKTLSANRERGQKRKERRQRRGLARS